LNNTPVLKSDTPILIVICGPTATGKSGLAIALAQRLNGVVLGADSRQVYREFDIGTAKPSSSEQAQVPHSLIDICEPTETLTLGGYQQQAQALLAPLMQPGSMRQPFLVGGTGLYIRSVVRGMKIPRVAPQMELRSQFQQLGQTQCYAFLKQVDATAAAKIHPNDEVRTLRALEVYYVTGKPISVQQGESPPPYSILQIGLDCLTTHTRTDPLTERIARRTGQMVAQGFVEEVQTLSNKYGFDLPLLKTLGYQEVRQYLLGEIDLEEAIRLTVLHTRQFAKRQRTWFRADPTIEWFDADQPDLVERVWQRVTQFLSGTARSTEPVAEAR
jgi:tRNA dimethylallyltransferase